MRLELLVANFEQTTSNPCTFQCSWSDFFSIQNSLFSHFWYQNVSHERNLAHVRPFIKHKICCLHKILYCLIDFSFFCSAGWCKDCSEPSTHLLFSSDCYFEFGTLAKLEVPVCLRAALEGHGCNTLYSQILARKPTNCEHRVESLKRSVQHYQRGATNGTASSSAIIGADNPWEDICVFCKQYFMMSQATSRQKFPACQRHNGWPSSFSWHISSQNHDQSVTIKWENNGTFSRGATSTFTGPSVNVFVSHSEACHRIHHQQWEGERQRPRQSM